MASRKDDECTKLRSTKDYSLFLSPKRNRPIELEKRKKLYQSMKDFGFRTSYPLDVVRTKSGKFEIQDGQNRFAFARELGLSVWFVVQNEELDIPRFNNTQKTWSMRDYASSFANQGNEDYRELLSFSDQYEISLSSATAILFGNKDAGNISARFKEGAFKIRAREKAHQIASTYVQLVGVSSALKTSRLLEAIYAVCQIPDLEISRLIQGAKRSPEKLIAYSTREGYLSLLEELYNFGKKIRVPIKMEAENAMRARNAAIKAKTDAEAIAS